EARTQVDFLCRILPETTHRSLDVACGQGRHVLELLRRNHDAYGTDLSAVLLEKAGARQELANRLTRADMRALPFKSDSFDLITSFFTSFGYFDTDKDHFDLLREWARLLRPGGLLFIDYLNAPRLK